MTNASSQESLDKLCVQEPDHPVRYGIGKLTGGAGLLAVSGGLGWFGWEFLGSDTYGDPAMKGLKVAVEVITAGCMAASGGYGGYLFLDGATSLAKPFGIYSRDGSVYYRNGGFTNKPSLSDKKFGKKVHPVDRASDLSLYDCSYVMVNGIAVKDTSLTQEEKIRMVPIITTVSTGKTTTTITNWVPQPYTEYTVVLETVLNDKSLRLGTITEDGDFASKLANTKGKTVYALGDANKGEISVDRFGDAFSR